MDWKFPVSSGEFVNQLSVTVYNRNSPSAPSLCGLIFFKPLVFALKVRRTSPNLRAATKMFE